MNARRPKHGWMMVEMVVAMLVLGTLAGVLAAVNLSAAAGNRKLWFRTQAAVALEAQLDCLTQTGLPLPTEEFQRLWPSFEATVQTHAGQADTTGLVRVEVTITGRLDHNTIRIRGQRYMPEREDQ